MHPSLAPRVCRHGPSRQGAVILLVLLAVVILSFSAYIFAELMLVETVASAAHARQVQARTLADSGLEYVAALLETRDRMSAPDLVDHPPAFQHVSLGETAGSNGSFSVIAPIDRLPPRLRFGLADESAKLNLNALPLERRRRQRARTMLLGLEGINPYLADAILDWLDADDEPREFGAESSYYQSLNPPYRPRNAKLDTLDDLLLVRGITAKLLYGEDRNQDGWLDPNENDGDALLPPDNSDGVLQRGWSSWLTVYGGESTFGPGGQPKIDLNQDYLPRLYDELATRHGARLAQFVVAYRLAGPIDKTELIVDDEFQDPRETVRRQSKAPKAGGDQVDFRSHVAGVDGEDQERGGLDLSDGPAYMIRSLVDLIGNAVHIDVEGEDSILESPWPADPNTMMSVLRELGEMLSTRDGVDGDLYINVNQAPREVLMAIPGMEAETADAIVAAQRGVSGKLSNAAGRETIGWLLNEGLVDMPTLRRLAPYLTARGDVFRVNVIGFVDSTGPTSRLEAVINTKFQPARISYLRDLPPLHPMFSRLITEF